MSMKISGLIAFGVAGLWLGVACSDDDPSGDRPGGAGAGGEGGAADAGGAGGVADPNPDAGGAGSGAGGDAGSPGSAGAAGSGAGGQGAAAGEGGAAGEAGIGGEGGAPPPTVQLATVDGALLGSADDEAPVPLYFWGADVPAGPLSPAKSTCVDACLQAWPAFHADPLRLPPGLDVADFGELLRDDGARQTTFKGWPLYSFAAEVGADSRSGNGVEGLWHTVVQPFYSLVIMKSPEHGNYVADGAGWTTYLLLGDTAGTALTDPISTCTTAGCRRAWPVVSPGTVKAVSSLTGALDIFIRPEGQEIQLSYEGFPIYYYDNDLLPGDTLGVGKPSWVLTLP